MIASAPVLHRPVALTKSLRLANGDGRRRIRISSNLLDLFGFTPGTRINKRLLSGGRGFELVVAPQQAEGELAVYKRSYGARRHAFETLIDVGTPSFVTAAIPEPIDRVHYTFTDGRIVGRPFPERAFHIGRRLKSAAGPLGAFAALSSGVDAACMAAAGFELQGLLEYRPQEARDRKDLTESGVLTALRNNAFKVVFNEDIFQLNWEALRTAVRDLPQIALLHACPQCDDFSPLKSKATREQHADSLQTTRDMAYEVLRLMEELAPACCLIENVPGFANAPETQMLTLKLRRWGYNVTAAVLDPRDFGDYTSRRRFYLVASIFPGFEMPQRKGASTVLPWDAIADQLPSCRDVSHTSSVAKGIATGRIRFVRPTSAHAPTIFKSQHRQTKDACYLQTPDGKVLFPTLEALQRLNNIPASFKFDAVGPEVATEQIGQSISWGMHHALIMAVKTHLEFHRAGAAIAPAVVSRLPDYLPGLEPQR